MATATKTVRGRNVVGTHREEYGTFTGAAGGTVELQTAIGHLEQVEVVVLGSTATADVDIYLNTNTTTNNVAGYEGMFHLENCGAVTYLYKATGRG